MTVIAMPALADGRTEGTLVSWLVEDGAFVDTGQELAEIETDKATVVYAAEIAGRLRQLIEPGTTVPVDAPMAEVVLARTAPAPDSPSVTPLVRAHGSASEADHRSRPTLSNRPTFPAAPDRVRASPLARRTAADHGIDASLISGSGPRGTESSATTSSGAINRDRVEPDGAASRVRVRASDVPPPRSDPSQQTVAKRMSQSKLAPEMFHLTARADMTEALALAGQLRSAGVDDLLPSINDLIVKAVAIALLEHPRANGRYIHDALEISDVVNVGIGGSSRGRAVGASRPGGEHQAAKQTLAREIRDLTGRARSERGTPADPHEWRDVHRSPT